jgi:two-component sensor histidine kinase
MRNSAEREAERLFAVRRYDILDTPPDGSFDRITALAAELFDVPISIISIVDADRVWFKSHHGLDGVTQIGKEPGLCASAILGQEAWVLENAATDIRSLANPLVAGDFGLRFYAGVPLTTHDGYNLGTLCVIGRQPRAVTESDIGRLRHLASVVMDQMELRLSARTTVGELQVLAREIDHRVMNSLQLVSSMLNVQARQLAGQEAGAQLLLAAQRVTTVARVHQHIFKSRSGGPADSNAYLNGLAAELRATLDLSYAVEVAADHAPLGTDLLAPIGLIVNELVTNGLKHGAGEILVEFRKHAPPLFRLSVSNAGDPLDDGFDPDTSSGLGMKVVAALARQFGGQLQYGRREDGSGAKFWLDIPV